MKRDHRSECLVCGNHEERWLLHNVRHRGNYRRLCTNCILKHHQGLFCPICLDVFEEPPPPHVRLMCLKCPSISHLSCVPDRHSAANFTCPPCANPNFAFFDISNNQRLTKGDSFNAENAVVLAAESKNNRFLDRVSARALVAAARIAAASMTKAATVARVEAERRVREAALAKKRAREALERLVYLAAKEKDSRFKASVTAAEQKEKLKSRGDGISKNGVTLEGNDKQSKGSNGLYSVSPANAGKLQTSHGNVG